MKKFLFAIMLLALPVGVLAAFQPATLTNGVSRVAVYTESQAKALFSQGYSVETKELGAFPGPRIQQDITVNGYVASKQKVKSIAKTVANATTTLTVADSGTTYVVTATGSAIILPAAAKSSGVKFRVIIGGAIDTQDVTLYSAEGDNIEGSIIVAGAVVDCNAADVLTFVADGENIGDYVEVMSNGTYWFPLSSGALTASKLTCSG